MNSAPAAGVDAPLGASWQLRLAPNPARAGAVSFLSASTDGRLSPSAVVDVLDVAGRRVARLSPTAIDPSAASFTSGTQAAAGSYTFCLVDGGRVLSTGRGVVVR